MTTLLVAAGIRDGPASRSAPSDSLLSTARRINARRASALLYPTASLSQQQAHRACPSDPQQDSGAPPVDRRHIDAGDWERDLEPDGPRRGEALLGHRQTPFAGSSGRPEGSSWVRCTVAAAAVGRRDASMWTPFSSGCSR